MLRNCKRFLHKYVESSLLLIAIRRVMTKKWLTFLLARKVDFKKIAKILLVHWCLHHTPCFTSDFKASNTCYALPRCSLYGFQESLGPY